MIERQIIIPLELSSTNISTSTSFGLVYPYTDVIDNAVGTLTNCRTHIKWKNIHLWVLLGQLYDDYEYFTIEVIQIMALLQPFGQNALSNSTQTKYKNFNVYLSGLDFVSSTFSQTSQCQKSFAHLSNLSTLFSATNNIVTTTFHPNATHMNDISDDYRTSKLIFHKTRQYADLNIWFSALNETEEIPSSAFPFDYTVFPHCTFRFNIKPIK